MDLETEVGHERAGVLANLGQLGGGLSHLEALTSRTHFLSNRLLSTSKLGTGDTVGDGTDRSSCPPDSQSSVGDRGHIRAGSQKNLYMGVHSNTIYSG